MSKKSKHQDLDVAPLKRTAPGIKSNIQTDWEQREWIEGVNTNLKKVVEFLNKFGAYLLSIILYAASQLICVTLHRDLYQVQTREN